MSDKEVGGSAPEESASDLTQGPLDHEPGRNTSRKWFVPVAIGLAAGIFIGAGGTLGFAIIPQNIEAQRVAESEQVASAAAASASLSAKKALEGAFASWVSACGLSANSGAEVSDGGHTLTIDGQSTSQMLQKSTSTVSLTDFSCLITHARVPQSIVSQMNDTTALQGRQSGDFGSYRVSWTYHPDSGFDVIFTLKDAD